MAEASSSPPDSQYTPNDNEAAIKDWTPAEKFHLLEALKVFGPHNSEKIQEHVLTKNLEETKAAVDYYTACALQHPLFKEGREQRTQCSTLAAWEKLLTDNIAHEELHTMTATAVRMIADLEDIPKPEFTENIDFRQVYHQIANAMEGKPMTLDAGAAAVLRKCIKETVSSSKSIIKKPSLRYFLKNLDLRDKSAPVCPRPGENPEEAILRHLASQRGYNPLNVPEEHLKLNRR